MRWLKRNLNNDLLTPISVILLGCALMIVAVTTVAASISDRPSSETIHSDVLDESYQSITEHELKIRDKVMAYTAMAGSLNVTDNKTKPIGNIFYISYTLKSDNNTRPLTFVFNGGPGAASAYLHMGALGPQRVEFDDNGAVLSMPAHLTDNAQSWLAFTDLVFVDPIGTGYSRTLKGDTTSNDRAGDKAPPDSKNEQRAWGVAEDADVLARFVRAYLTREQRWLSPIYLVGESYGGFRVSRLSRILQTDFGISLNGLVLISPALDFSLLWGNERSLWPWAGLLPSYAAVAAFHQRSDGFQYMSDKPRASLAEVERIALSDYLTGLASDRPSGWQEQAGHLAGLNQDTLMRWNGRVPPARFAKALLAEQHRLVSLYDASITLIDPDPAATTLTRSDSYLDQLGASVTAAFNHYVREHLAFKTDLPYLLLNKDVFESWNWRSGLQRQQGFVEAVKDLKQAMSQNNYLNVLIVHGVFDLVTPYFASAIAIKQMALDSVIEKNITLKVYHGGHMPYLHRRSRLALFNDARQIYQFASADENL